MPHEGHDCGRLQTLLSAGASSCRVPTDGGAGEEGELAPPVVACPLCRSIRMGARRRLAARGRQADRPVERISGRPASRLCEIGKRMVWRACRHCCMPASALLRFGDSPAVAPRVLPARTELARSVAQRRECLRRAAGGGLGFLAPSAAVSSRRAHSLSHHPSV